jgi:hypothetical protein
MERRGCAILTKEAAALRESHWRAEVLARRSVLRALVNDYARLTLDFDLSHVFEPFAMCHH